MVIEPQNEERRRGMKCGKILINNGQTVPAFIRIRKWMFLYLLFLLAGCERRELTYYNTAEITLTVDWSQSGLNNSEEAAYGASAIFYPVDGESPKSSCWAITRRKPCGYSKEFIT